MNIVSATGRNVIVEVGIPGPRGQTGPSGGAADGGESVTDGLSGVSIPVSGYSSASEYQVSLVYLEDPGGNGILFAEKTATEFTVKHHGTRQVAFGYVVFSVGA